jgi:vitamin B12 transporter
MERKAVSRINKTVGAAALLSSALASPALAQDVVIYPDEASITSGAVRDDTIIVSGTPQPRVSLPTSVATLTDEDMRRLQLVSVADVLALTPGVSVSRNGPVGGFTGVRIRGADAAQTLVVIDGVRVSDPTSPGGGFDFGSLLSGNIARIDVLRGSNSVVWGSDAIGGVVLIESGGQSGINTEYGSDDSVRVDGRYRFDAGPVELGLGGGWFRTDGISAARSGNEADGFRQYRGNVQVRAEIVPDVNASASLIYADSRLEIDGFAPPTFAFGDTEEFQDSQEIYAAARIEQVIGGDFRHQVSFSLADINRDTFNPAFGSAPSFAARGRSERIGWQGSYGYSSDALSGVVGVERQWSRSRTGDAFSSDAGRTSITGVYAHANLRPVERLRLGVGLRFDDHRRFGSYTSLSAHGLYQLTSALALRSSYSEGFKAPTLFQLSPTPSGFGNPALRPEESTAFDIGFLYRRSRSMIGGSPVGIRVEGSLFRRDSRNLIDFVGCSGPAAPPICAGGTRPFGTYANTDRARVEGGELEVTLLPSTRLSIIAGYAYTATRDQISGNRLARRPLHTAIFGADYSGAGFTLGADIRLVGDSFDDAGNFTRLDGYTLASLRGSVDVSDTIQLYGRVENLFDADYQNVAGYSTYGRTFAAGVRGRF